eukprot:6192621-Pleurochrysis_carterae.AAC.3
MKRESAWLPRAFPWIHGCGIRHTRIACEGGDASSAGTRKMTRVALSLGRYPTFDDDATIGNQAKFIALWTVLVYEMMLVASIIGSFVPCHPNGPHN